jgi:glutathione S-transferase
LDLNLKLLNLMNHEFMTINPQHNVPTIVDDGFFFNESQAISAYLINRYGGQNS